MKNKIIAVDFDGTLCEDKFPAIGEPRTDVIESLLKEQQAGASLILWTCRRGEDLTAAVYWCASHGLKFEAINENLFSNVAQFGGDTRKVYADEYWDDKAVLPCEREAPERETTERERTLAAEILNILDARVDLNNKRAGHYGAFNIDGVIAKIKAEEAATLREFIKIIIDGHDASERDEK